MNKVPQLQIYLSRSTCIYQNLAFEEWLFRNYDLSAKGELALLWSNTPSVVIGRHQNPWLEVDVEYAKAKKLNLVRRFSGGGAVYHDLGNVNISILTTQKRHCRPRNLAKIAEWLNARFNVNTLPNKRDDILLQPNDRKISGTAARIAHGRAYHHFSLLVCPNLPTLRRSLHSPYASCIQTTATPSIRAKAVGQLCEEHAKISVDDVVNTIVDGFKTTAKKTLVDEIVLDEMRDARAVACMQQTANELRSPQWTFERCPRFTIRLPDGSGVERALTVERGRVVQTENSLYTLDSLFYEIKH